jgi:DNA-binding transcriptional MerR regulator
MDVSKGMLKIGVFARLAETNLRTLRYYEEMGLLVPAVRSDGGFRYYRPTDANRVRMIRNLQELGLQLDQIAELLRTREAADDRHAWLKRVETALDEQERLIESRIQALKAQKKELAHAVEKLRTCTPCSHSPMASNNFCEPCQRTGEGLPDFLSALF